MLDDLQARADAASPFVNSIFAAIWAVIGFGIGLASGGAGKQFAFAILAAFVGYFFLRLVVMALRYALMLTIIAAVGWAAWFIWSTVIVPRLDHP